VNHPYHRMYETRGLVNLDRMSHHLLLFVCSRRGMHIERVRFIQPPAAVAGTTAADLGPHAPGRQDWS